MWPKTPRCPLFIAHLIWQERSNNKIDAVDKMSETTPDPALAAEKATTPDALALNTLSVIGLIDAHDGATALLRSARGEGARVHVGDDVFGVQITAIGDDQVLLTNRWGQTKALQLPQS